MKIAVVGTGISGLSAAWALAPTHEVVVYETARRLGGHAHTVDVPDGAGTTAVDTGFIVYNERTYPHLTRLFAALDIATQPSDMSLSFSMRGPDGTTRGPSALDEYGGSLVGLLGHPAAVFSKERRRLVADILRFRSVGDHLLASAGDRSIADLTADEGFSDAFVDDYLVPMAAAIWSARPSDIRAFPAEPFLQFFSNHGLIDFTDRPLWRTVTGGSRSYVDGVAVSTGAEFRLGTPVTALRRNPDHVEIASQHGIDRFDEVVLATHSDQALGILGAEASPAETEVLSSLRYTTNKVVLHSDTTFMPARRRLWSSWNYTSAIDGTGARAASVTYWMNRLQGLGTRTPLFVTLNPLTEPSAGSVHGTYDYAHPVLDGDSTAVREASRTIQGADRVWFAGAYLGYGFHEDGAQSGLNVAAALGSPAPWHFDVEPMSPAPAVRPLVRNP